MATLKPRPVYKKQTTKKTMTEQPTQLETITKVQSHLPDVQLIDRQILWEEFRNRIKINNYECRQAMADLKSVVNQTKELYSKVTTKK
tara:strand:+ start:304 stop:567 length:264 start_codon:yes stop_codon:yes gene_type:complete